MKYDDRRMQDRGMSNQYSGRREDNPPNFGSARSDYGNRAYGGRLNDEGMERGFWDRASDEVSSWFGDEDAERRRMVDERRDQSQNYGQSYGRSNRDTGSWRGSNAESWGMSGRHSMSDRDFRDLRAGDVMTRSVITVHPDDSIQHAARMMSDCDCGAVPVVDWQGRMMGMITDRDITVRMVANRADLSHARVSDCMTNQSFACHVSDSLDSCMRSMSNHKIRRMPIVDDRNRVVGIVSQADLAQHAMDSHGRGERRRVGDVVGAISEPTEGSYS
jgi:CBS domain-containing protein